MTPNFSYLKSRTVQLGLLLGLYNALFATQALLPVWATLIINALGFILLTYYHVNPSQTYNPPK